MSHISTCSSSETVEVFPAFKIKIRSKKFRLITEEVKHLLYHPSNLTSISYKSKIQTNQRFLAVRRIEKWWINNNWKPKYKRCRERLDREYQELFPTE